MTQFINLSFRACVLVCLLSACQESKPPPTVSPPPPISFADSESEYGAELTDSQSDLHLFTLPTPIQTAAVLRAGNFQYDESLLMPLQLGASTNLLQAVHLGVYMMDLGYASIYNQRQSSLLYLEKTSKLKNELGIAGNKDKEINRQFLAMEGNSDSLSRLILDSYAEAHSYFQSQEREGVGLLILIGCYIEGLHLCVNTSDSQGNESYQNLIAQQKMFLNSLLELLRYFEYGGEIVPIIEDLNELKETFSEVQIRYRTKGTEKDIHGTVSAETVNEIRTQVKALRARLHK